jgi:iron complex transport system ATP-binding protein
LIPLQSGEIRLDSKALQSYSPKELAKIVAYVPQSLRLQFAFTVGQVVLMGRSPHLGRLALETRMDGEKARKAMEFTGVDHLAHRQLDQLSGGEQQRVFLARALCQEPLILLLDEPTAALDLAHQSRIMDLMYTLTREAEMTVIMVSHDLNAAAMYGDDILLLSKGRIAQCGSPEEVLTFELLEEVYGCPLLVDRSPLGNYPRVHQVPQHHLTDHQLKMADK